MNRPPRTSWLTTGVRIGRFGGIPILVAPSWLLSILVVMYVGAPVVIDLVPDTTIAASFLVSAVLGVLLGVSVLLHELGHCLVARYRGVPVYSVRLYLLGGVSQIGGTPRSPAEEAQIAAAGPVVSILLTGVFAALTAATEPHTLLWLLMIELAVANGLIAVFNLIPALPLDGGRVLRAGVWRLVGRRPAGTTAAVIGGYVVAGGLVVWAIILATGGTKVSLLQCAIALAMAAFVGGGAWAERASGAAGSSAAGADTDFAIAKYAHPLLALPAATPVAHALSAAAGRQVALSGEHGNIIAVLDLPRALSLQFSSPAAPAIAAAQPIGPEHVVLFSDSAQEVLAVVRATDAEYFLVIGSEGESLGILRRIDMGDGARR